MSDSLRLLLRGTGLKVNQARQNQANPIPSAGGGTGLKRKRDVLEENLPPSRDLDESDIRRLHKLHKIKITDLRTRRQTEYDSQHTKSRKRIKEISRVYPQPLQKFSQLQQLAISRALIKNISGQAYNEPTEVQIATIPLLLKSGREEPDLLTVAPTGSGKTLAFLIPLIHKTVKGHRERHDGDEKHATALILAPTKELVDQIVNEGRKLISGTGVRITKMRKGMLLAEYSNESSSDESDPDMDENENEEPRSNGNTKGTIVKADILVATPSSIIKSITKPGTSTVVPLPHITTLILDEADYLLDPLFRDQVLSIWSACTSSKLQTSLWSATIGSSIEELAVETIMSRYSSSIEKPRPLLRTIIGLKDTSLPTISHKLVYGGTEHGKLIGLRQLLRPRPALYRESASTEAVPSLPFLIFTQTIARASALYDEIKYDIPAEAGGSTRFAVLHSNLSDTQRANTMTEFRQGKIWVLITTDLLSRGVDFRGINVVINYDIPTTAASYVHRAGRTGRAGRQGGVCVTLWTQEDLKYMKPIANLIVASEKASGNAALTTEAGIENGHGIPPFLLTLPDLSKNDRKDLKERGVGVRRAVKESDDKDERRKKGRNRIGTSSGYVRKMQNRKEAMIEASKRRRGKVNDQDVESDGEDEGFAGFED